MNGAARRIALIAVLVVAVAGVGALAQSRPGGHPGHSMPGHEMGPRRPPAAQSPPAAGAAVIDLSGAGPVAEVTLAVAEIEQTVAPGVKQLFWVFHRPEDPPRYPGPTIVVREGQRVRITLKNQEHYLMHTIHFHGVKKPWSMDGVPDVEQPSVNPGETFTYEFVARNPGTHWYHCHVQADTHIEMGLLGAFIIKPEDEAAYERFTYDGYRYRLSADRPYDREYVLVLDDIDQVLHNRVLEEITYPMREPAGMEHMNVPGMEHGQKMPMGDKGMGHSMGQHSMPQQSMGQHSMGHPMGGGAQGAGEGKAAAPRGSEPLKVLGPDFVRQHMVERDGQVHPDAILDHIHHVAMMSIVDPYDSTQRKPQYFTVNGQSFPFTLANAPILVRASDLVKIRIVNASYRPASLHLHGHEAAITHVDGYKVPNPVVQDTIPIPPAGRVELALRADKEPGVWMVHDHAGDRVTNAGRYPGGMLTAIVYEETDISQIPNRTVCDLAAAALGRSAGPCAGKPGFEMGPYVHLTAADVPRLPDIGRLK